MSDQKRITLLASNLEKIVLFVIVSGLILSVITILGLSSISNYGLIFIFSIIFLVIMTFLFIAYFIKNGIKDKISNIQKEYIDLIELNKNELESKKNQLKERYNKKKSSLISLSKIQLEEVEAQKQFYSQQKDRYSFKSKLLEFKKFIDYYSFHFDKDKIYSYLKLKSQEKIDIEVISDYYQEYEKIPKLVFKLLYNDFFIIQTKEIWSEIKKNQKLINLITQIIMHTDNITPKYRRIPFNILCKIMEKEKSFSIRIFNQNINYISKFKIKINSFYAYLKEEKINYQEYVLWEEVLKWKDLFIDKPKFGTDYWILFMNCIQLNNGLKYREEIKNIIIHFYIKKTKPEILEVFSKRISESEITSKLLFYISRNKEDEKLGVFILENKEKIIESAKNLEGEVFFKIFYKQLRKGNFIIDNNDLFKIHVDDGVFDLSFLNQLYFNPLTPIDFEYAFNHYFTLNTSITSLLRTLRIEGKQKLFLLTFTSEKGAGGIAKAINELNDEEKFPELSDKYELLQYSDSARIGISKKAIFSIEELRKEMLMDLKKTIPNLDIATELHENFNELLNKCYIPIHILSPKDKDEIKLKFDEFINLKANYSDIINVFQDLNQKLENNDKYDKVKNDFNLIWKNLKNKLENYPPNYQILLHELESNPKKIKVFGNYQKIDPFIKIKELYANKTENKETLLISAEFREESSVKISIEEINQRLINSLPFYSLVSKEIKNLRNNPQFEKILDFKFLNLIISSYSSESKSLIEFCLRLTDDMGLKDVFYYDLEEFSKNVKKIVENNIESVEKTAKILKDNLLKYRKLFDDDLIGKMASSFIKSCTCVSLTIFKRIRDAYKMLNEEQVKNLKAKMLNEIDLDIIREKKFNLVFYSLVNYYRANKIRPIFKSKDPVNESKFHDKVFEYLFNFFPHDIEDESNVARGKLDLLVNKIPIELKLEKKENRIDVIFKKHKDQFFDYLYKKECKIGFLYVFENTKKKSGYSKKDIDCFFKNGYYCIIMILRGNFPYPSQLKRKKTI